MRQLVYTGPGRLQWRHAPDPELSDPASAIVQPLAVSRCDLDLPMATAGLFPGPYPVGHEIAGRVVAVGSDVGRHTVGDVVIVPFQVSCGHCAPCRRARFAACDTFMAPIGGSFGFGRAGGGHGGGLADLLAVPNADHLLVAAPPDVPVTTLATMSDNVVDGYRAVGPPLAERPDAEVLIVAGAPGALALYAAAAAVALGSPRVRFIDRDAARVRVAAALGADARRYLPDVLRMLATTNFDPGDVPITTCTWEEAPEAWLEPAIKLVVER